MSEQTPYKYIIEAIRGTNYNKKVHSKVSKKVRGLIAGSELAETQIKYIKGTLKAKIGQLIAFYSTDQHNLSKESGERMRGLMLCFEGWYQAFDEREVSE